MFFYSDKEEERKNVDIAPIKFQIRVLKNFKKKVKTWLKEDEVEDPTERLEFFSKGMVLSVLDVKGDYHFICFCQHAKKFYDYLHPDDGVNEISMHRGYTPFGLSVQNRHLETTRTLMEFGADPFDNCRPDENPYENPFCPYWLALKTYFFIRRSPIFHKHEGQHPYFSEYPSLCVENHYRHCTCRYFYGDNSLLYAIKSKYKPQEFSSHNASISKTRAREKTDLAFHMFIKKEKKSGRKDIIYYDDINISTGQSGKVLCSQNQLAKARPNLPDLIQLTESSKFKEELLENKLQKDKLNTKNF